MRPQELRTSIHRLKPWRLAVIASMFAMVFVLLAETLYHPGGDVHTALSFLEVAALSVVFTDLAVNFSRADNKSRFIRRNWFELMLFVPFVLVFEIVRVYALFEATGIQAMPFLMRTKVFVKGGHIATHVGRSEPARLARIAVVQMVTVPNRYKQMKYRGLLSF